MGRNHRVDCKGRALCNALTAPAAPATAATADYAYWFAYAADKVYPGYYPALGLYVEGSPPVGSLRMEGVRDGFEDYEYLKLVAAEYGATRTDAYSLKIIGPVPAQKSAVLRFPTWEKKACPLERSVRRDDHRERHRRR